MTTVLLKRETIKIMSELDNQRHFWETAGAAKTFTHPIDFAWLSRLPSSARIIDYGCGYGRITGQVQQQGFARIEGVDTSAHLIERARQSHPTLTFRALPNPPALPYPDTSVDAILLFAVLTCIPTDAGQQNLVTELSRVLRPGGLLYVSDLLLQTDQRSQARYQQHAETYGNYGVFETHDGAICRHHTADWLQNLLLDGFTIDTTRQITVETMNANSANALQILAVKR
ncbi:Methyltransferase domain-containing protein [Actinoplanes derwentensis]|uniref:Methyltransferase domain-containing protein n=2 Tax=Actinoplanes derwentensis TaxID=113562 RepID=A0A1H2DD28_9ACTN|nr:SAM-dependent methyltransferase [Actinoplanes derwentensis]SDT80484.1 Methyltransferase domain-containing protein [Actinoplanes derwentensis]